VHQKPASVNFGAWPHGEYHSTNEIFASIKKTLEEIRRTLAIRQRYLVKMVVGNINI